MANLLLDLLRASDAPPSQYDLLGLPAEGRRPRSTCWCR
jgi:hypothetical protein